jgi:hypothetical protein
MATDLQTSNGVEIAGLNAEEQVIYQLTLVRHLTSCPMVRSSIRSLQYRSIHLLRRHDYTQRK